MSYRLGKAEWLVVILMVAVMVAMAVPLLGEATDKRRVSVCLSNIKQMMVACQMYAADYNDRVPGRFFPDETDIILDRDYMGFQHVVEPYIQDREIYLCPAGRGAQSIRSLFACSYLPNELHFSSYGAKSLDYAYTRPPQSRCHRFAQVLYPDKTFFLAEVADGKLVRRVVCPFCDNEDLQSKNPIAKELAWRHAGKTSFAFCDGHAEALDMDTVRAGAQEGASNADIRAGLLLWGHEYGGDYKLADYE